MDLNEHRRRASELSGGTSPSYVKALVLKLLKHAQFQGSILDYAAGKGELLQLLAQDHACSNLMGMDLFERPSELPEEIGWIKQDLNEAPLCERTFDAVVCSEVIEHLENPRHVFRSLAHMLKPNGLLILTMPNQESLRSYMGLLFRGHFTHFLGDCYPAHITALLRLDLVRICAESGFSRPDFYFTNHGNLPKFTGVSWQKVSFGLLRGRLFSENVGMVARKV
ncbi:MAG: methyltransferase domain-containing protein [Planctomycetes bacterium]|nr:methyltransferase domain-containing protein [Planctomycetota bacterium]